MRNILTVIPQTRINDSWIVSDKINATPVRHKIVNHRIAGEPNDFRYHFQADFYEHFACDIVSETVLNYPYPYISEKTLRSIASKRMFILLGAPRSLQLLHSKGFVTFNDLIDEAYDLIDNPEERFLAVIKEVEKFCALPLPAVKLYMKNITPRLDHNFQILENLQQSELTKFQQVLNDSN